MHKTIFLIPILLISLAAHASIFGEENLALGKMVLGQMEEIRQLTDAVGVARDQMKTLQALNDGIERAVRTIETVNDIERRARGLNPKIGRISDLTNLIYELRALKRDVDDVMEARLLLADQTIKEAALQSETAYLMGGEMISSGSDLSREARTASPGRAAQISASANANSMMAEGVQPQTLSHIASIEAMNLELHKGELDERAAARRDERRLYNTRLASSDSKRSAR